MKFIFFALSLLLISCQSPQLSASETILAESHHPNEVPLKHAFFTISYNPEHRLPNWVSYKLDLKQVKTTSAPPQSKFYADPLVISLKLAYAKHNDFGDKTFDRVQMAPTEDFRWSKDAHKQTYVMTNTAPMKSSLNRGAWKKLELKVRKWACTEKELTVISGPIINADLKKFKSGVSIPKKFFKIVIDETPPQKAIAFIFDQDDAKKEIKDAAASVQDVEMKTGFEFINTTNSTARKLMRNKFNLSDWKESHCP